MIAIELVFHSLLNFTVQHFGFDILSVTVESDYIFILFL